MAAFAGCLVMVLLSFALVYGLIRLGIVPWAAFLIVSAFLILLAALAILIVYVRVRGISGLRKTRESVQEDLALLRRDDEAATTPAVEAG
jgi:hypothetical protein